MYKNSGWILLKKIEVLQKKACKEYQDLHEKQRLLEYKKSIVNCGKIKTD